MHGQISNKQIKDINSVLEVNNNLCFPIFNSDNSMSVYVRERLLSIANFVVDLISPFFLDFKLYDIVLGGSICSYTYNKDSDLDIFIIISDIKIDNHKLNFKLTDFLTKYILQQNFFPLIYSRKVDIKIKCVSQYRKGVCTYSLLNKSWISEPYKGSYNFTPQQLWASYQYFETNIKQIADKISGTEKYLTLEGCEKLNNLLTNIKLETYAEKEQDILHEYSLKYNVYRLAQYFELFKKYENFIMISTQKDERKKHE